MSDPSDVLATRPPDDAFTRVRVLHILAAEAVAEVAPAFVAAGASSAVAAVALVLLDLVPETKT